MRRRTRFGAGLCGLLFGLLCAALPCAADTIIETGVGANGPSVNAAQFESQGWTQTQNYADVSISVALFSWMPGATFNITAYLTDGTGPAGPLVHARYNFVQRRNSRFDAQRISYYLAASP